MKSKSKLMAFRKSNLLGFLSGIILFSGVAHSEALSTTTAGIGIRTISFVEAKSSTGVDVEEAGEQNIEPLQDPIICQRISSPSSLGLELGAGGCVHGGGFWTLAHSVSAHFQMIYYPFASRTSIEDDLGLKMKREFFGDFYLMGLGGFAKITHNQAQNTPVTLSTDVLEFGGGLGWSYRIGSTLGFGFEAKYLVGSILSDATSGSTNMLIAGASLTAFL